MADMVRCGTWQGYDRHCRRGEKPCRSCSDARNALKTVGDMRAGRRKSARVPFALLGELLRLAPPDVIAWAEETLTAGTVHAAQLALEIAMQENTEEDAA